MNRILIGLALLFASLAAQANVPCYGGTVVYAPTVEQCPKRISAVNITPTEGGFDLSYTSEGSVTVEIAVEANHDQKCPGCPYATGTSDQGERRVNYARLDDQAIKNATGMSLNSQQAALTAGNYSTAITGLANGADYTVHLLPIESDGDYGQAWSINVTTLSASAPTNDAPEWYVGAGGSDLADGLTRATRFLTLATAASAVAVGDDVALEPGTEFTDQPLDIPVGGTLGNYAIWGTNYESGGNDYWWHEGPTPSTVARAGPEGTYDMDGCRATDPATCLYNESGAVPINDERGLVHVTAPYVATYGLSIKNSAGNGLKIDENYSFQSKFRAIGVDINGTVARAVQVTRAVADGEAYFEDISIAECSLRFVDGLSSLWPGCVSFDSLLSTTNSGIIMRDCSITNSGGEGLTALRIGDVLFEDCVLANIRRVALYPDASSNVTFRRMFVVLTSYNGAASTSNGFYEAGVECYGPNTQDALNNAVYDSVGYHVDGNGFRGFVEGNLGCPEPFRSQGYDPRSEGYQTSYEAVGVTLIGSSSSTSIGCTACTTTPDSLQGITVRNSAFIGMSGCGLPSDPAVVLENNYHDAAPSANCQGTDDVYGGALLTNDPTWSATNMPTIADATPGVGSSLLGAGTFDPDSVRDYLEAMRDALNPDIGAVEVP